MVFKWTITIDDQKEYFLLKKEKYLSDYLFLRKPHIYPGLEKSMEIFSAVSDEEAKEIGHKIAKKAWPASVK